MKKITNFPTKGNRQKFHRRADQLVLRCATSPQYVKDVILTYMYQLQQAIMGTHNRRVQNIIDGNLIDTFKETYPREFKIALIKNEAKHGRS